MKNILSVLVGLLVVLGCVDSTKDKPQQSRTELDNNSDNYSQKYSVYTLDGCEYILVGVGNDRWGSHKGNCKNSIHY